MSTLALGGAWTSGEFMLRSTFARFGGPKKVQDFIDPNFWGDRASMAMALVMTFRI